MLASHIRIVLHSSIASFVDVLSLTLRCRMSSFGKALHLEAYPGTDVHVRMKTTTSSTMSKLEAVTMELNAVHPELERLQAENVRLREYWPEPHFCKARTVPLHLGVMWKRS